MVAGSLQAGRVVFSVGVVAIGLVPGAGARYGGYAPGPSKLCAYARRGCLPMMSVISMVTMRTMMIDSWFAWLEPVLELVCDEAVRKGAAARVGVALCACWCPQYSGERL